MKTEWWVCPVCSASWLCDVESLTLPTQTASRCPICNPSYQPIPHGAVVRVKRPSSLRSRPGETGIHYGIAGAMSQAMLLPEDERPGSMVRIEGGPYTGFTIWMLRGTTIGEFPLCDPAGEIEIFDALPRDPIRREFLVTQLFCGLDFELEEIELVGPEEMQHLFPNLTMEGSR